MIIAERYRDLVNAYLERNSPWRGQADSAMPKLYGLPVEFSPSPDKDPQWAVINFNLEKEPGCRYATPTFRLFE